jgi:hypothetical protein
MNVERHAPGLFARGSQAEPDETGCRRAESQVQPERIIQGKMGHFSPDTGTRTGHEAEGVEGAIHEDGRQHHRERGKRCQTGQSTRLLLKSSGQWKVSFTVLKALFNPGIKAPMSDSIYSLDINDLQNRHKHFSDGIDVALYERQAAKFYAGPGPDPGPESRSFKEEAHISIFFAANISALIRNSLLRPYCISY